MDDKKYSAEVTSKGPSLLLIKAVVPAEEFENYRKSAVAKLSQDISIPGFRKGHVPEKVLLEKIGEERVLYSMAEKAIGKAYPQILIAENIDAIGEPRVQITKIAKGNDLNFTIETATIPEVKLPDYKKIAKEKNLAKQEDISVSDEDIKNATERVKASLALEDSKASGEELPKDKDGKPILPELTEEKIKKIGYESLEDFRTKLEEGLLAEKERAQKEKKRLEIAEEIMKSSEASLPEILIDSELVKMLHQFESDIERMGMKSEEYLKTLGKSREDLEKEWKPDAEKRVKLELILSEISKKENLKPADEEIEKEVSHMLTHYPDANKDHVRAYVINILSKEGVFAFLEEQK
jgi:trigger factor